MPKQQAEAANIIDDVNCGHAYRLADHGALEQIFESIRFGQAQGNLLFPFSKGRHDDGCRKLPGRETLQERIC